MRVYSQQSIAGCALRHRFRPACREGHQGGLEDRHRGIHVSKRPEEGGSLFGRHGDNGRVAHCPRPHGPKGRLRKSKRVKYTYC